MEMYNYFFISYCTIYQCTTLTKEKMLYNLFLITTVIYFFLFLYQPFQLMVFDLTLFFIRSNVFIMYFSRNLKHTTKFLRFFFWSYLQPLQDSGFPREVDLKLVLWHCFKKVLTSPPLVSLIRLHNGQ